MEVIDMAQFKPVRIVKTEYGTYSLHFTNPAGRRRRISTGSDYQRAKKMEREFNDWLMDGKNPEAEQKRMKEVNKRIEVTLTDFFPKFMERHGNYQSESMQALYHVFLKNICRCKPFRKTPLLMISKGLMQSYMYTRMKIDGVTPATVNREASFVRGMLARATEWEDIPNNPLHGLRLLKEADKRQVNLAREQAEALIEKLNEPVASIAEFAIYSGFRKENILGLRIEKILFHDLTDTAEVEMRIKGGRTEIFPLGRQAVLLLKRVIGNRAGGYVFINVKTNTRYYHVHKQFDRVVRKLGLTVDGTKLRFHDLRHVFATWLHREGVSLDVIRPLLGHRNRSTTDRYTTIDRLACGKVLELLPEIRKVADTKMASVG
jgi:integrase